MKNKIGLGSLVLLLGCTGLAHAGSIAPEASIKLQTGDDVKTFTLSQLRKELETVELLTDNPAYDHKITYEGFWLERVLPLMGIPLEQEGELVIEGADGYVTTIALESVGKKQWLFAFQEKGGGWTPVPHGDHVIIPAPFYIVGTTRDSYIDFPWPYQVTGMHISKTW